MENLIINFLALGIIVFYAAIPPILIFIHYTIGLWRRLGIRSYYVFVFMFAILDLVVLFTVWFQSHTLFEWRIYNSSLALIGIVPLGVGIALGIQSIRALSFRVLMGVPEIDPILLPSKLVQHGIYRYIRHPRYLEFILESIGIAILSGLFINFIFTAYLILGLFWAIYIEEKELEIRLGEEYKTYKKQTSRFFPKMN